MRFGYFDDADKEYVIDRPDTSCALAFTQVDQLIDYIKTHPNKPM